MLFRSDGGGIVYDTSNVFQLINRETDGILSFATQSLERMRIDSSGNVGIGTSSPGEKLEVAGNIKVTSTSPDLYFNVSGGSNYSFMLAAQENASNTFEITPSTTAGGSTFSNPVYSVSYDGLHKWFRGSTESMRLDSSGNLGLGVTPSAWESILRAEQFGYSGSIVGGTATNNVSLNNNWYSTTSGVDTRINAGYATR